MSVVGIIAEFNPFHSGHEFLLNQARLIAKDDPIIVMMSGDYVQRGEMAILDKWSRAQAALGQGADLVFELPFSYAVQPADIFGGGALRLLSQLGVRDLVFGVEEANLNFDYLGQKIANVPQRYLDFQDYTQTYATQYNQMVAREVGHEVNQPNLTLAVSYAVANTQLPNPLNLYPVTRLGANHDDLVVRENAVASATAIRNLLWHQKNVSLSEWLPPIEIQALDQQKIKPNWNLLFDFLKYRLESSSPEQLR